MSIRKPGLTPARVAFAVVGTLVLCWATDLALVLASAATGHALAGVTLMVIVAGAWVLAFRASHRQAMEDDADARRRAELLRQTDDEQ
jgi:Na+/melibiose symporter-like transporter